MTPETVKIDVRAFLARHFQHHDLQDDDDIFALGFVNSLFALQLVMFVEKTFGITVEDQDLSIDNFRSISAISNLVGGKAL